ncbi:MAG: MmcQ/YjbR family DNA-binding protein, partial [Alphaproteobacteria bacterium]
MSVSWAKVQKIAREFPGVVDASAHGRSGFKVGKKFLLAFNEEENAIGIRISFDERELLMSTAPKIYYVTDHYRPYPSVLVSLDHVSEKEIRALIERRWRDLAPAKLAKAYDEQQNIPSAKPRRKTPKSSVEKPPARAKKKTSPSPSG